MKKNIFFSFLFFLFPTLYAQCTYLPSADVYSKGYASIDFLYWEGMERGLEYALKNNGSKLQLSEPDFNFVPTFRLTLGAHLPNDDWDLEFSYSPFFNHISNQTDSPLQSVWTSSVAFGGNNFHALWNTAAASWHIRSHFFDLYLKNELCLSSAIDIAPAFGLKMALIHQHFNVGYGNGNTIPGLQFLTSLIEMKNESFNLGPAVALSSRWQITAHFDFLASLSAALLGSHFDVSRDESNAFNTAAGTVIESIDEGTKFWTFRPQADLQFGVGWRDDFCRRNWTFHYGLSASYEAQVWWKQNMLFRFVDQTNAAMISPTQGNLFFHGLTFAGFIDY